MKAFALVLLFVLSLFASTVSAQPANYASVNVQTGQVPYQDGYERLPYYQPRLVPAAYGYVHYPHPVAVPVHAPYPVYAPVYAPYPVYAPVYAPYPYYGYYPYRSVSFGLYGYGGNGSGGHVGVSGVTRNGTYYSVGVGGSW